MCVPLTREVVHGRPEAEAIYPWPGGSECKSSWTSEHTGVEKPGDELWIGVKV